MKRMRFILLLGCMLMAAPAALLAQGTDLNFKLVNKTGFDIHSVFLSPHDSDDWDEDVMGQDILADGESVDIKFHPKAKAKIWDLRVDDSKGKNFTWFEFDLTTIEEITIRVKDGKTVATWK